LHPLDDTRVFLFMRNRPSDKIIRDSVSLIPFLNDLLFFLFRFHSTGFPFFDKRQFSKPPRVAIPPSSSTFSSPAIPFLHCPPKITLLKSARRTLPPLCDIFTAPLSNVLQVYHPNFCLQLPFFCPDHEAHCSSSPS